MEPIDDTPTIITSQFVRGRNALFAHADFASLYVDHYLHLMDHGIQRDDEHDQLFKVALAAFSLHAGTQPRNTHLSWTLNFQKPLLNIFLVADNVSFTVAGRVFSEGVKESDHNGFYQEIVRPGKEKHRSYVDFAGDDPLLAAERYYDQSEQRPARFFQLAEESFAILSAHPDYDREWFQTVTQEEIRELAEHEDLKTIERRPLRWHCGCSYQRILEVLLPTMLQDPESLFGDDDHVVANCPRCGAQYRIERDALEQFIQKRLDEEQSKED